MIDGSPLCLLQKARAPAETPAEIPAETPVTSDAEMPGIVHGDGGLGHDRKLLINRLILLYANHSRLHSS